jgi:hypothetical protein
VDRPRLWRGFSLLVGFFQALPCESIVNRVEELRETLEERPNGHRYPQLWAFFLTFRWRLAALATALSAFFSTFSEALRLLLFYRIFI